MGLQSVFEHQITVRFYDVDRAGIVFFGRIFEYAHAAFEELLMKVGLVSVFEAEGWGMPLVHAEADFSKPMRMGDRIDVKVSVEKHSERSITFAFALHGAVEGEKRADVKHVHAFVDLETMRSRIFPDSLRAGLIDLGLLSD